MATRIAHMMHEGTKRSGASTAVVYSCERQGQPSIKCFAGLNLRTDWRAGP